MAVNYFMYVWGIPNKDLDYTEELKHLDIWGVL